MNHDDADQQQEPLAHVISLATNLFQEALRRHLDEVKPDRIAKQQIESLSIDWTNREIEVDQLNSLQFSPTHALRGSLSLSSRYVTVEFHSECYWLHSVEDDNDIWLYFRLAVNAHPRAEKANDHDNSPRESKLSLTEALENLQSDPLVRRLLDDEASKIFCEAVIHATKSELEERVDISEEVAESIRRTILSHFDSSLDVIELLLSMPHLPTMAHKDSLELTCQLADRAKLRLLEDAMFDACEKEGEEEIIDDLRISHSDSNHSPPRPKPTTNDWPAKKKKRSV